MAIKQQIGTLYEGAFYIVIRTKYNKLKLAKDQQDYVTKIFINFVPKDLNIESLKTTDTSIQFKIRLNFSDNFMFSTIIDSIRAILSKRLTTKFKTSFMNTFSSTYYFSTEKDKEKIGDFIRQFQHP
jgi:hypothetical protein